MHPDGFVPTPAREGVLVCRIPRLPLHSGHYGVSVWLADMHQDYDVQHDILSFHFASPDFRTDAPPVSSIGPTRPRRLALARTAVVDCGLFVSPNPRQ